MLLDLAVSFVAKDLLALAYPVFTLATWPIITTSNQYAQEYTTKISSVSSDLTTVRTQIQVNQRDAKLAELTLKELGQLDGESAVIYKSVGKAFIEAGLGRVKAELDAKVAAGMRDSAVLTKTVSKLEKELADSQNALRELISRVNAQAREEAAA